MTSYGIAHTRWASELRILLKDDALSAFLAIPTTQAADYGHVKTTLLIRSGISLSSKIQELLQLQPKPHLTAAQYFGTGLDALPAFAGEMTVQVFATQLMLEIVFKVAVPHISASVRALHKPTALDAVHEMDQYIVTRGLNIDKLWKKHYSGKPQQP